MTARELDRLADRVVARLEELAPRSFFTPVTLAKHLSVSRRTVETWLRIGDIPSYMVGGSRRIHPRDVDKFLDSRRRTGP